MQLYEQIGVGVDLTYQHVQPPSFSSSQLQEDYIKDELKNLKCELMYAQEEVCGSCEVLPSVCHVGTVLVLVNFCPSQVKRIQSVPLVIGQFLEAIDQNYAIVGSTTG